MEERVFATALGEIHYWVNPGRGRPIPCWCGMLPVTGPPGPSGWNFPCGIKPDGSIRLWSRRG